MPNTLVVKEQLNRISNRVIEQEFPEFMMASGALLDVSSPEGAGYDTYSYDTFNKVGSAAIIANGADDLPLVNAEMERHYGVYRTLANAYKYTVEDMEKAQLTNTPLNATMAVAARETMEAEWDRLCYEGDANFGLQGFIDYPNVPTDVALNDGNQNGGTNSSLWIHKTPAQIYRDLRSVASQMRVATFGKYFPAVYILPQEQFDLILETPYPDNQGDETILSFFLKTQRMSPSGVQQVLPAPRLAGAFQGGADGLIAYTKRSDKQEIKLGFDFQQLPVQIDNLCYKVPNRMRIGGTVVYRPLSVRQLTGI
jgi:hypothetical protein